MTEIQWNDRLGIGVDQIDNAHKKLFAIINRMIKLNEDPKNQKLICEEGIKYFKNYTLKHFAEEEAYMQSIGYKKYDLHKRLHENLRSITLPILEQEVIEAAYSFESVQHFINVCLAWLNQHILSEDRSISGRVPIRNDFICSQDEVHNLAVTTAESIENILGLKAQTASEYYRGENIGSSIFYRMTYRISANRPVLVYLGFEEKLILAAAKALTGTQVNKAAQIPISAVSDLSKQMIHEIGKHIPQSEDYKLEKENILSYDLLLKTFQNTYPPYSLLFRTNEGYFVFCIYIKP